MGQQPIWRSLAHCHHVHCPHKQLNATNQLMPPQAMLYRYHHTLRPMPQTNLQMLLFHIRPTGPPDRQTSHISKDTMHPLTPASTQDRTTVPSIQPCIPIKITQVYMAAQGLSSRTWPRVWATPMVSPATLNFQYCRVTNNNTSYCHQPHQTVTYSKHQQQLPIPM